jgi:hypothetical protein
MDMELIKLIVSALPGIAAIITLIYQLVKYVRQSIKEKRWAELISLVMGYMERAETMFESGADRKEWVMAMVKASLFTLQLHHLLQLNSGTYSYSAVSDNKSCSSIWAK